MKCTIAKYWCKKKLNTVVLLNKSIRQDLFVMNKKLHRVNNSYHFIKLSKYTMTMWNKREKFNERLNRHCGKGTMKFNSILCLFLNRQIYLLFTIVTIYIFSDFSSSFNAI